MACLCGGHASFENALRKGNVPAVLSYLHDDPLTVARSTFRHGNTLWHMAANAGHVPLLEALVARLSAVWPTPQQSQQTQHQREASGHGHGHGGGGGSNFQRRSNPFQRISDGLRGRGPDPSHLPLAAFINTANWLGHTALMTACTRGHADCVHFLLSMGANPWARDRGNCTALHYATLRDHASCIDTVLQHPSSARPPAGTRQSLIRLVDLPNCCGYTPVHFAAAASKPAALTALLAAGANIAARCWTEGVDWISGPAGSTPLHFAARRGDMDMCMLMMRHYLEVLRDNGTVDPRLHADVRSCRPHHLAAARGSQALTEMLTPSTPLSYIFAGTDAVRLYNVPKLKALASAALQGALLAEINELELEAAERRKLVTVAAVAAARAAATATAAAAAAAVDGGVGSSGANGVQLSALSRASSLVATFSGAVNFVRRQSMRSMQSLKQRVQRPRLGPGPPLEPRGYSNYSVATVATEAPLASSGYSGYGAYNNDTGYGPTSVYGLVGGSGYAPGTPQYSNHPGTAAAAAAPYPDRGDASGGAAALGSAAVMSYGGGGDVSGSAAGPSAGYAAASAGAGGTPGGYGGDGGTADGGDGGLLAQRPASAAASVTGVTPLLPGSGRSAFLGPHKAPQVAASGRYLPLPGGVSPVRGCSFDSDPDGPLLPPWGPGGTSAAMLPPLALGAAPLEVSTALTPYTQPAYGAGGSSPPGLGFCGGGTRGGGDTRGGSVAGGSPRLSFETRTTPPYPAGASPPAGYIPSQPPGAYPHRPQPQVSPFAQQALQAQPLSRQSSSAAAVPGGSSPTGNGDNAVFALSGRSPPLSLRSGLPSTTLGLHPVDEGGPTDEMSAALWGVTEPHGDKASHYLLQQSPSSPRRPALPESRGSGAAQNGFGAAAPDGQAGAAAGASEPLMAALGVPCSSATFAGSDYGASRSAAADPAGCSPKSGLNGGAGGSGMASRRGSGRLVGVGGSRPASGTIAEAACVAAGAGEGALIGSDTSEDYCGICFERPAMMHIRPCQHVLCAECCREVTRMVETQPPCCPFCRGLVRGFSY